MHFIIDILVAQDSLIWQVLGLVYAFSVQTLFFVLFCTLY